MVLFGIIMSLSFVACNKDASVSVNVDNNSVPMSTAVPEVIVTNVDISALPEDVDYIRHYSNEEKIELVRNFIRQLTWQDITSEKPDEETGVLYTVVYTYEDGTTKTYYFKEDKYFKFEGIGWKIVENFDELKNIIKDTPTD